MRIAGLRALALAVLASGCDWSLHRMVDQPRCEPSEATRYLANGMCDQLPPAGTVRWRANGTEDARPPTTRALLERGRDRFAIFCAPCHGHVGNGVSKVASSMTRRPPPSLHEPRLRAIADQHLHDVISHGWGLMPSYAHALVPRDRWAVVGYVRVLQLSQDVALADLTEAQQAEARRWLP